MDILLCEPDLFRTIGGGQTSYRRLVETHPRLDFHYPVRSEAMAAARPPNAHPFPLLDPVPESLLGSRYYDGAPGLSVQWDFREAFNLAASVAGRAFDVVDVPDYAIFGWMLRPALAHHGVRAERIALSLHGVISMSLQLNWPTMGELHPELGAREFWHYTQADLRYGISRSYLDEWEGLTGIRGAYLDPLLITGVPAPLPPPAPGGAPDLQFIGRLERAKGPDVFLELLQGLDRSLYGSARMVGPDDGNGSTDILKRMASRRNLAIDFMGPQDHEGLVRGFGSRQITCLTSRRDTLNLVALESLLRGCPALVGSGAGVIRHLRETWPSLPFVEVDVARPMAALEAVADLCVNYDRRRRELLDALASLDLRPEGPRLDEVYRSPGIRDGRMDAELEGLFRELLRLKDAPECSRFLPDAKGVLRRTPSQFEKEQLDQVDRVLAKLPESDDPVASELRMARDVWAKLPAFLNRSERTEAEVRAKRESLRNLAEASRLNRVCAWREMSRLERIAGNDLVAVTYALRGMRLLGEDRFRQLPYVTRVLRNHGFPGEAEAAELLFGGRPDAVAAGLDRLRRNAEAHRENPFRPFDMVDDRRSRDRYRSSIVVSLYKAAGKLAHFMELLLAQPLVLSGACELIFVETGSPEDDYGVFRETVERLGIPEVAYARTEGRETIQSAWNRGLGLVRAPFLTFLGVDETLVPGALGLLVEELEGDPSLDWVVGDAIVAAVDPCGAFVKDVMFYDRSGFHPDLAHLETTYLTYVGGLYRRDVHDRFGYFDASFRGAGDTEFKTRVGHHLRCKALPRTLGVFLDYPEARTTQSPMAELEDLRAWYFPRSEAGMACAFGDRPLEEALMQFLRALRYRKTFHEEAGTDLDYACALGAHILERDPETPILDLLEGARRLQAAYRRLDHFPGPGAALPALELLATYHLATTLKGELAGIFEPGGEPDYRIFNDNRYDQHANLWPVDPEAFPNRRRTPAGARMVMEQGRGWPPAPGSIS